MPAKAATFSCGGAINQLSSSAGGTVTFDGGYGIINICTLTAASGGVDKETCTAWYSTLLTLQMAGRGVTLYFDTANSYNTGLTTTCSAANFGNYNFHPPYFFTGQ